MTEEERAANLGWTVGQYRRWLEYLKALNPLRSAYVAECSCKEGIRTPFLPDRDDAGYQPYPKVPPELVAWGRNHQAEYEGQSISDWQNKPHRVFISHTSWQERDFRDTFGGNWFAIDRKPVLWQLGSEWTDYERTHPSIMTPFILEEAA